MILGTALLLVTRLNPSLKFTDKSLILWFVLSESLLLSLLKENISARGRNFETRSDRDRRNHPLLLRRLFHVQPPPYGKQK